MPTYEYNCQACQHQFDEFQSMSDNPLRKCPKCGKLKLKRAFGIGAAVIFKGSGFYQTDYRSESYKASAKADQDAGTANSGADSSSDKSSSDSSSPSTSEASGSNGTSSSADASKPAKKASSSKEKKGS